MRFFTPEQANRTLPLVKRIVEDILKVGSEIHDLSSRELDEEDDRSPLEPLLDRLDGLLEELESLGCYYKDSNFTEGLVDFPAVLNGKEVLLCWRNGEPRVAYYHDSEAGFAGRRPLPLTE